MLLLGHRDCSTYQDSNSLLDITAVNKPLRQFADYFREAVR
jgi:hypothetical protein